MPTSRSSTAWRSTTSSTTRACRRRRRTASSTSRSSSSGSTSCTRPRCRSTCRTRATTTGSPTCSARIEPQVVVHLAAIAHAGSSNKDPMSTFGHSLRTLENALDYARGNAEHFVYFSSSMVYGNFLEPGGLRGPPARPDRHLRRAEARRREDRDRLQAGVRPRLHDHPAVGALRARLRQPAGEPDLHRERAGRRHAARGRRGRRAARLLLHRRRRRGRRARDRPARRPATRRSTSRPERRGRSPT